MGHQNNTISSQTFQGATAASFCRILDREEALESFNAELYDGVHPQVCGYIRHIVMSTQQAQKNIFCMMCLLCATCVQIILRPMFD